MFLCRILFTLAFLSSVQAHAHTASETDKAIHAFIRHVFEHSDPALDRATVVSAVIAGFQASLPEGVPQASCLAEMSVNQPTISETSTEIAACLSGADRLTESPGLLDDMMSEALHGIDPFGSLLRKIPDQGDGFGRYHHFLRRNARASVGITIKNVEDRTVEIIDLVRGGAAEAAGVKAGDHLVAVDGTVIDPRNLAAAIEVLRGPVGTSARLSIIRREDGTTTDIVVLRALTPQDRVVEFSRGIQTNIETVVDGYTLGIRIGTFLHGTTERQIKQFLKGQLSKKSRSGISRIVIDLRGGYPGELTEIARVADLFLDAGRMFSITERGKSTQRWDAKPGNLIGTIPVYCVVDEGIQTGAAIFATALRHHKRGQIVGRPFAIHGVVRTLLELDSDRAISLKTASIMQADGSVLQGEILPDIDLSGERAGTLAALISEVSTRLTR